MPIELVVSIPTLTTRSFYSLLIVYMMTHHYHNETKHLEDIQSHLFQYFNYFYELNDQILHNPTNLSNNECHFTINIFLFVTLWVKK